MRQGHWLNMVNLQFVSSLNWALSNIQSCLLPRNPFLWGGRFSISADSWKPRSLCVSCFSSPCHQDRHESYSLLVRRSKEVKTFSLTQHLQILGYTERENIFFSSSITKSTLSCAAPFCCVNQTESETWHSGLLPSPKEENWEMWILSTRSLGTKKPPGHHENSSNLEWANQFYAKLVSEPKWANPSKSNKRAKLRPRPIRFSTP